MPSLSAQPISTERVVSVANGWPVLLINLLLFGVAPLLLADVFGSGVASAALGVACAVVACIMLLGYFTLQPNQARVLILFGAYKGTVRQSGFHWTNPLFARYRGFGSKDSQHERQHRARGREALPAAVANVQLNWPSTKLSLRARNFSSDTLKVNDKRGNPVEIGAVIVWRIEDTAQAAFDVDDYVGYVEMQSESAIRSIASRYAYDHGNEAESDEITLRGGADDVALALKNELQLRLAKAGVTVEEARITHLAYAPEIAPAMLRRQQAEAVIAARRIIVQNAVTMVRTALTELDQQDVVKLDDERRAAMVSNLLVVLCGNSEAAPVINTGTLYT